MECTGFRDALLDVLYGEAEPDTVRRVEQHLKQCRSCDDEMAGFRRVKGQLASYTLPARTLAAPRSRGAWPIGLAAAAALVVALGGAFAYARVGALEARLAEQERRHGRELDALRASLDVARPALGSTAESALLLRVEQLLKNSEERQGQRLEASLRELAGRSEAQRRLDLARVRAGLSYLDGRSGHQAARTAELMGYVLQAAEKK